MARIKLACCLLILVVSVANGQTIPGRKLYSCRPEIPMKESIILDDFNRSAAMYKIEIANGDDWGWMEPLVLSRYFDKSWSSIPQLRYDTPYRIRVSVKPTADADWSSAGEPSCTFTLTNSVKLYNCRPAIPMREQIVTDDLNRSAGQYKVEFAIDGDWTRVKPIELDRWSRMTFSQFPQLRYDTPYKLRISVKQNDKASAVNEEWSRAGTESCTFTLTNVATLYSCPPVIRMSDMIITDDLTRAAGRYKLEFARDGDWSRITEVELAPYSRKTFADFPQLLYDTQYSVRVRVKQNDPATLAPGEPPEIWSLTTGSVCSLRTPPCPAPVQICIATEEATCGGGNNGSATATVTGGKAPYTYSWSSMPAQSTLSATGLGEGTYVFTVTDANGCTKRATTVITRRACTP